MRLGKWTLAFAAVAFLCGTAMAQVDDFNRLCMHNGSYYYIIGYDHNNPNIGVGKYYPSFSHRPSYGIKDQNNQWYWPWKIIGWAFAGMQASDYGRSPLELSPALSEELGDAFYSLVALAESLNVDLETALDGALAKYEARLALQGHAGSARPPES